MIKEIIWLRSIACLAVVLVHSLSWSIANFREVIPNSIVLFLGALKMSAMFGTPTFVFISEFLISKAHQKSPREFLKKRIKFILIPYFSMSVFYAFIDNMTLHNNLINNYIYLEIIKNFFLGDFHGYFILIIFQFYLIHMIYSKYLSRVSPKLMLSLALLINSSYLLFFNFVEPLPIPYASFIWNNYSLSFIGWIFYFVLAYYCGKNIERFNFYLDKYKKLLLIMPVITFAVIVYNRYFKILDSATSKRIDVLFYTISIICLIYFVSSKIKKTPNVIAKISNYSFGIYLLHPFVQFIIPTNLPIHYLLYILLVLFISVGGSILATLLLNKIKIGTYIVGKIGNLGLK